MLTWGAAVGQPGRRGELEARAEGTRPGLWQMWAPAAASALPVLLSQGTRVRRHLVPASWHGSGTHSTSSVRAVLSCTWCRACDRVVCASVWFSLFSFCLVFFKVFPINKLLQSELENVSVSFSGAAVPAITVLCFYHCILPSLPCIPASCAVSWHWRSLPSSPASPGSVRTCRVMIFLIICPH